MANNLTYEKLEGILYMLSPQQKKQTVTIYFEPMDEFFLVTNIGINGVNPDTTDVLDPNLFYLKVEEDK